MCLQTSHTLNKLPLTCIVCFLYLQGIISHVFRKRIRATIQQMAQERAAQAAAAAAEEGMAGQSTPDTAAAPAAADTSLRPGHMQ
jgi:hypothetical protein